LYPFRVRARVTALTFCIKRMLSIEEQPALFPKDTVQVDV
jgi:hypothetical protein